MPRQNRVTPFGEIVAAPERGTFFGNRGCLHDDAGRIRRAWQLKRWIVCVLEFKGRKRRLMRPGHYTELFFLDEATAFAAGHRPCAECRRERFNAFRDAIADQSLRSAIAIDEQLHTERLKPHRAKLDDLPDGVFILLTTPQLVWRDSLLCWSHSGYMTRNDRPHGITVDVLTPPLTLRALGGGYVPAVHPTAERKSW